MQKRSHWRALLLIFGAAALCIGLLLIGRSHTRARVGATVGSEKFHTLQDQPSPGKASALVEMPAAAPTPAVAGMPQKRARGSPWPPASVAASAVSTRTGKSHGPVGSELMPTQATNAPPLIPERPNHKDWNTAESVAHGQAGDSTASEDADRNSEENVLLATLKSEQQTFIAEQKELWLTFTNADESAKAERRQAQKQELAAFLARQNQLREQLRQLKSSKEKLGR